MSMQMPLELQKEIRSLPGNKHCADCGTLNPQWASVSMGSLVCLNCSGQHRALGVHLSFVRSVTMDSWSEKQIRAMRAGGNRKMNDFFAKQGVPKFNANSIRDKYDNNVAEYYREVIEAARDLSPKPTTPPPQYQGKAASGGGGGGGGGDDFEGLSAEERYERHKRLEAEARERMRAKFGSSGGLGSGSFGGGGIGSDPSYRPGQSSSRSTGSSASDWFSSAAKATSQWGSKVSEDVKKAKVADKLKSGWSWFTQSATAVIDKAKANIAKDSAPKLYSRDSPTPTRLYNPDAARAASANDKMAGFGSSKTGSPITNTRTGFGSTSGRMQGFGSSTSSTSSAASSSSSSSHQTSSIGSTRWGESTASTKPKPKSNSIGWDDDLFNDDLDLDGEDEPSADGQTGSGSTGSSAKQIADLDDGELLGDIDSVLGDVASPSSPGGAGVADATAKVEKLTIEDEDEDDFFKEFDV